MKLRLVKNSEKILSRSYRIKNHQTNILRRIIQRKFFQNEKQIHDENQRVLFIATPFVIGLVLIESIRIISDKIKKYDKPKYKKYIAPYLFTYLDIIDTKNEYQRNL